MTQAKPAFSIPEFELRNSTNPYLTPAQSTAVSLTESRVNGQLDFLAQMLGWSGPNYWTNLPDTVSQKRQLLGGTYGVYNSFLIPKIYEIRNWDNTIIIDRVPYLRLNQRVQVVSIVLGEDTYTIESVQAEGDDKFAVSIGELSDEFFERIAAGEPLLFDAPTERPAPFSRPSIGISGDYAFHIASPDGSSFRLYPGYDSQGKFPFEVTVLFEGSVYYFDQPIYFTLDPVSLVPEFETKYDPDRELWYFKIPDTLNATVGFTGYLVWNNNGLSTSYAPLQVDITQWSDPSDWGSKNVLDNFRGTWNNKGGALPFNFAFDSLSIHGFNEQDSIIFPDLTRSVNFNEIVNYIYSQRAFVATLAPPEARTGDLWWNDVTGVLAAYLPNDDGFSNWIEIDYRRSVIFRPDKLIEYATVADFQAAAASLDPGAVVRIQNANGLSAADNVLGLQGVISGFPQASIHLDSDGVYWVVDEFLYNAVSNFQIDAPILPYRVQVVLTNVTGLSPSDLNYEVTNLKVTLSGSYKVILVKYYNNRTWEIYPDSLLKFIANSALHGTDLQGEMWWDFGNPNPGTRATATFYEGVWIASNFQSQTGAPNPVLDLGVVLFYCNGDLLEDGVAYTDENFIIKVTADTVNGKYNIDYHARTFAGKLQFPEITISDNLTTAYREDISDLVFSGVTYYMSPSVHNAETPLRLWKNDNLQVVDNLNLLNQNTFVNPLVADLNSGPGPENWEKYFVRLPLEYGREEGIWQKTTLICRDFGYWGSSIAPEKMKCPPESKTPMIYEELFLYGEPIPDYTYVYSEPYLYSNVAYFENTEIGGFQNSGVFPASDVQFDDFAEAELIEYEPLHERKADTSSAVNEGYGDWVGVYVNVNPRHIAFTGHLTTDLENNAFDLVSAPVWDASIYKFAPTCENTPESYNVDTNHYKVGYAYFVADASAAEDGFFDLGQEAAWRYPVNQPRTSYLTPR